jgi:hypothetical protein
VTYLITLRPHHPEALTKRRGRTLRGERRQRAQTETPETWEARHCRPAARQWHPMGRIHNPPRCDAVASERAIVAGKFRLQSRCSQRALAKVDDESEATRADWMEHPTTEQAMEELTFREALLPPQLRVLRQKHSQKARQQKRFRFYSLYAHACRADTLQSAWEAVRRNDGAPGVDGVSIEQIAATPQSEAAFVAELQRSLKNALTAPRRCKLRPLGIPTVRDRVKL